MPFNINPGDTLLPKLNKHKQTSHLWVVLTKPDEESGKTVIVNLTTKRDYSDSTTVLDKGDHPYINRPSVINYAYTKLVKSDDLKKGIESGYIQPYSPFSLTILIKIQKGLLQSPHTPKKIINYCSSLFK